MDPDEALRQLRAAIADHHDATSISMSDDAADRVVEHATALDIWLSSGGFPPAAWAGPAGTSSADDPR